MAKEQILVVEDDEDIGDLLRVCLESEGFVVHVARDGHLASQCLKSREWDLVFLDYMLPGDNGLILLNKIAAMDPDLPVIFMTAHSSIENAVEAMKAGAVDYLTKPLAIETVVPKVRNVLEVTSLRRELRMIRSSVRKRYGFDKIVGSGSLMRHLMEMVKTVAESEAETILLLGESGVGKNLIAQAIHYNSRRANRPFLTVTCTALSENLLESELFGHEKGAFTDAHQTKKGLCELADGGTLFLDEIGDMPLSLQGKLLGFLENRSFRRVGGITDRSVDVRLIAATNINLKHAMREKRFREDLFYRLNVMEIPIPSLRERAGDVPLIATHFVKMFNEKLRKNVGGIGEDALAVMRSYHWPGNIRELRNLIERAMILTKKEWLDLADFPAEIRTKPSNQQSGSSFFTLPSTGINLDDHEKDLIREAMELSRGNQSQAAKLLGISRNQLIYRLKKFCLN